MTAPHAEAGADARAEARAASASASGPAGPSVRGRPRNAATDAAIIEAALRLLEEGASVGALSIEGIARAAGVAKATVYRRWPGKDALMLDVLRSLEEPGPRPAGVSVRDDLVTILEFMRRRGLAKRNSALMRSILAQMHAHRELWRAYDENVIEVRRELLRSVLRRGVANGEIRADTDPELLADLFTGPMLSRAILHEWRELPEGLAERIVDTVLEGVSARG